jgi:hypothetical protein
VIVNHFEKMRQHFVDAQIELFAIKESAPDGHEQVTELCNALGPAIEQLKLMLEAIAKKW